MKILVDVSHPAHVHFFRHAARIWQYHGHVVKFVARNKEITFQLLEEYQIPYQDLSTMRKGMVGLGVELVEHQYRLTKIARSFKPDIMLNIGGTFIVHAGKLLGIKTCVFTDTEHAKLSNTITFPFATWICTPQSYKDDLGKKQVRYKGYQELAYLHPNHFKANSTTLSEVGLEPDQKFFIVRFVSWGASHDIGQQGLSDQNKLDLVSGLADLGRVIITSEGGLPPELEKYKMRISPTKIHDLLSYASLYVGEGATMATEAAILGTPSVYINPLGSGNLSELTKKYQLIYHFQEGLPGITKAIELAQNENANKIQQEEHQRMLQDNIDVTTWMVNFVEDVTQKK